MKCIYCGNNIPDGFNFCSVCGNSINQDQGNAGGNGFYRPDSLGSDYGMSPNPAPAPAPGVNGSYDSMGGGYRQEIFGQPQGSYSLPPAGVGVPSYAQPTSAYNNSVPNYNSQPKAPQYGKGQAIASMILGISSLVCTFTVYLSFIGVICGIIGLCLAGASKRKGYTGGMRKAGFVTSLITTIIAAIVLAIFVIAMIAALGEI